jgi:hypothetical protein
MKTTGLFALFLAASIHSVGASAAYLSTDPNDIYTISFDNGVLYIYHGAFAPSCPYGRVEIRDSAPYSTEYARRMTAAILMAKSQGKKVTFTWNDATQPCVLNSIAIAN